eukprot:6309177-Amphidinium_carterae.1
MDLIRLLPDFDILFNIIAHLQDVPAHHLFHSNFGSRASPCLAHFYCPALYRFLAGAASNSTGFPVRKRGTNLRVMCRPATRRVRKDTKTWRQNLRRRFCV